MGDKVAMVGNSNYIKNSYKYYSHNSYGWFNFNV